MSGGSLDYVYSRVQDAASSVRGQAKTALHLAFADHLDKVAGALHDLEWVWSFDSAEGDEVAAIEKIVSPQAVCESEIGRLEAAIASAQGTLESLKGAKPC